MCATRSHDSPRNVPGRPGKRKESQRRPYREVALIYDELVGDTAFELWKQNFELISARYGLQFEVAADIACGTGNAVRYLAGICSEVYGVDASPEMLEVAGEKVGAPNVVFLEQSFTGLELPRQVDLLTCNFDSLNYLIRESDLAEALDRFSRSIKPGGFCLFDMNTTRELQVEWGTSVFLHRVSVGMAVWESHWDPDSRINTLEMTNFLARENGLYEMSQETHQERSYDTAFVLELLGRAGFAGAEAFDAKGLGEVTDETRRVQFLARR
jgi:ubiquinone/menaquinone biosynthesis C-methylase UbiE